MLLNWCNIVHTYPYNISEWYRFQRCHLLLSLFTWDYNQLIKTMECLNRFIDLIWNYSQNILYLIKHTSISLLVFGGDFKNNYGAVLCHLSSVFNEAFLFDCNQEVWKNLGFYSFTRACLLDAKVKHQVHVVLGDGTVDLKADPHSHILMQYEQGNEVSVAKSTSTVCQEIVCQKRRQNYQHSKKILLLLSLFLVQDRTRWENK